MDAMPVGDGVPPVGGDCDWGDVSDGDASMDEDAPAPTSVEVLADAADKVGPGAGIAEISGSAMAHWAGPASGWMGMAVTVRGAG